MQAGLSQRWQVLLPAAASRPEVSAQQRETQQQVAPLRRVPQLGQAVSPEVAQQWVEL